MMLDALSKITDAINDDLQAQKYAAYKEKKSREAEAKAAYEEKLVRDLETTRYAELLKFTVKFSIMRLLYYLFSIIGVYIKFSGNFILFVSINFFKATCVFITSYLEL